MEDEKVTIPLNYMAISCDEYTELYEDSFTLGLLLNALFENATRGWKDGLLRFDDEAVCHVLMSTPYRNRYKKTLEKMCYQKPEQPYSDQ